MENNAITIPAQELRIKIGDALQGTDCAFCGFGPDAVAVKGDGRSYGPSVYVRFTTGMTMEEIATISNRITNTVPGISRVMMEIEIPRFNLGDL